MKSWDCFWLDGKHVRHESVKCRLVKVGGVCMWD